MNKFGDDLSFESQFTEQELKDYAEAFKVFDLDGSGSIDANELGIIMGRFGLKPSEKQLHDMISEVDADGSGEIDWIEFLYLMKKKKNEDEGTDTLTKALKKNPWQIFRIISIKNRPNIILNCFFFFLEFFQSKLSFFLEFKPNCFARGSTFSTKTIWDSFGENILRRP